MKKKLEEIEKIDNFLNKFEINLENKINSKEKNYKIKIKNKLPPLNNLNKIPKKQSKKSINKNNNNNKINNETSFSGSNSFKYYNKGIILSTSKYKELKNKIEAFKLKKSKSYIQQNKKFINNLSTSNEIKLYLKTSFNIENNNNNNNSKKNINNYSLNLNTLNYSVKDYIQKHEDFLKEKFMNSIKNEHYENLIDYNNNNIYSISQQINHIKKTIDLYKINFYNNCLNYIQYLNDVIIKEKKINEKLENKIENQKQMNDNLNEKILIKKNELNQIKKWYLFFIEVKEKKLNVNFDNFLKYKNKIMFNNVDEFINQINEIKNKNLNLLKNYNNIKKEILNLIFIKENLNNEFKKNEDFLTNEINQKTEILNNVKLKNNNLINDKNIILKNYEHNSKKIWIINNINSKLSNTIYNLYNNLYNLNNKNNITNLDKYYFNNIKILKNIENFVCFIINKIDDYCNKSPKLYSKYILILKKIKKMNIKKEMEIKKKEEKEKMNILKNKLTAKKNKLIFLPKKKVDIYYKLNMKNFNKKNFKNEKIEKNLTKNNSVQFIKTFDNIFY